MATLPESTAPTPIIHHSSELSGQSAQNRARSSRYASALDLLSLDLADRSHDQGSGRPPRVLEEAVRRSGPLASRDAPKHTLGAPDAARRPDSFLGTRDSSTVPADILGLAADIAAAAPRFDDSQFSSSAVAPSYDHLPAMTESEYDDSYLSFSQSGGGPQELSRPMAEEERSYSRSSFGERTVSNQPSRDPRDNMHNMHFSERCSAQQVLVSAMRWGRVVSNESVMARAAVQSEQQLRMRSQRRARETVVEGSWLLLAWMMIYGVMRVVQILSRGFDQGQGCPLLWRGGEAPQGRGHTLASLAGEACTLLAVGLLAAVGLLRPDLRAHYCVLLTLGLYVVAFPFLPSEPSCDDLWRYRQCAVGKDKWRTDVQGCGPQGMSSSVMAVSLVCMSPHIVPELKPMLLCVTLFIAGYLAASAIYLYATELGYYTWVDVMVDIVLLGAATVIAAYRKYKIEVQQQYADLLYHEKSDATRKLLDLLQDFLPDHMISQMLRLPSATIADQIPKASVLFLVISDFEGHMRRQTPDQLLDFLNTLFGKIDRICFDCQVTKIETVGEEYVAAVGVKPEDYRLGVEKHREVLARLIVAALVMSTSVGTEEQADPGGPLMGVQFRMGLHTGPVVAGVIGQKLPRFRLFGDTMNTAARMMQKGVDGELQFGEETRACMPSWARHRFRGKVEMKGKGQVDAYILDRLGEDTRGEAWEQIRRYGLRKSRRSSLGGVMPLYSLGSDDTGQAGQVTDCAGACRGARTWTCAAWGAWSGRLRRCLVNFARCSLSGGDEGDVEWLQEFYYFRIASHLGRRSDRLAVVMVVLTAAEALAAELLQPLMGDVFGVRQTWVFLALRAALLVLIFRWRLVAQNKDWVLLAPRAAELWRLAHACVFLTLQLTAYAVLVVPLADELGLDLSASQARERLGRKLLRIPLWQLMFLLWYGVNVMDLQLRLRPTTCFVAFSLLAPLLLSAAIPAVRSLASAVQLTSMFIMGMAAIQIADIDEKQDRYRFKAERQVKSAQHRMDSILSQLVPPLVADELSRRQSSWSTDLLHQSLECSHSYQKATIACSDLVGFTALASTRTAAEVVAMVTDLFGRFDWLSDFYRICKIETVGDAYIAGQAARPLTSIYRPISVVVFGVEIIEAVNSWSRETGIPLECRVGVHTGECIGGVVGKEMKRYHLFGQLLSVLELLESTAPTGQVHLSRACMQALEEQACAESLCSEILVCAPREELALKTSKGDPVLYHDIGGAPTFVVQSCAPKLYDPEAGSEADSDTASVGAMVI